MITSKLGQRSLNLEVITVISFHFRELMQCIRTEGKKLANAQPTGDYAKVLLLHVCSLICMLHVGC